MRKLLLAAGISFLVAQSAAHAQSTYSAEAAAKVSTHTYASETEIPGLDISVSYPALIGEKGDSQVNQALHDTALATIKAFKNELKERGLTVPYGGKDSKLDSYLTTNFEAVYIDDNIVSVRYFTDGFVTREAHPNHWTTCFNYQAEPPQPLFLEDIFAKDSKYLQVLSDFCIAALKKKIDSPDEAWIKKGAGPDEKNFRNFCITKEGLVFAFDPYQVAAYYLGRHLVTVPYENIREILNPGSPVYKLAQ